MDAPEPQRLVEMEERLRVLQEQLEADLGVRAEEAEPPPSAPPASEPSPGPSPAPPPPPRRAMPPRRAAPPPPPDRPRAMAGHLVRAMRELLDGYEIALSPTDAHLARLDVSAGPFADTHALESFARAVRTLPGVIAVEVRGYEGTDRAIVEIELADDR